MLIMGFLVFLFLCVTINDEKQVQANYITGDVKKQKSDKSRFARAATPGGDGRKGMHHTRVV